MNSWLFHLLDVVAHEPLGTLFPPPFLECDFAVEDFDWLPVYGHRGQSYCREML